MHGGYTKPVATGTSAIYVALQALKLKKGSEILLSPVNDSGPFNCVIALGYTPKLVDSKKLSYNTNLKEIKKRIGKKTKAFLLTHIGGSSAEIGKIYIFPNYMLHSVNPFYGEGERRSISFNANIDQSIFDIYSR